jgi:hypothetical protein
MVEEMLSFNGMLLLRLYVPRVVMVSIRKFFATLKENQPTPISKWTFFREDKRNLNVNMEWYQ